MIPGTWRETFAPELIGNNAALIEVLAVAERVAPTDCTVLITGESGTGKDLLARAIHRASGRARGAFVPLNCGAIPETLLESELFGHVRGAFTGAVAARAGRFALAEGGTLFLDEVGEMSLHLQTKLLRVIQEKEFSPVGESKTSPCDVRILAATNCDLEQKVAQGAFRDDLFWRLNVVPLELPPLRQRPDDLEGLALFFVRKYNEKHGRQLGEISPEVFAVFRSYAWPGNIRQLENVVQRVVVIKGQGTMEPSDVPPPLRSTKPPALGDEPGVASLPEEGVDLRGFLEDVENSLILQALERTDWNKNRAAGLLQLNRTTLVEKLKKKGLTRRGGKGSTEAA